MPEDVAGSSAPPVTCSHEQELAVYRDLFNRYRQSGAGMPALVEAIRAGGARVSRQRLYQWHSGTDPEHRAPPGVVNDVLASLLGLRIERVSNVRVIDVIG